MKDKGSHHCHIHVICDTRDARDRSDLRRVRLILCTRFLKLQIMPPYDDWNKIDEDEDEELQDISVST